MLEIKFAVDVHFSPTSPPRISGCCSLPQTRLPITRLAGLALWAPSTSSLLAEAHDENSQRTASCQRPHAPQPACLTRSSGCRHERLPPPRGCRCLVAPQHRCSRRRCLTYLPHGRTCAARPPCLIRPILCPTRLLAREKRLWASPCCPTARERRRGKRRRPLQDPPRLGRPTQFGRVQQPAHLSASSPPCPAQRAPQN
jgi:hypothetical protein